MRSYLFVVLIVLLSVLAAAHRPYHHGEKHAWPETMHKSVKYAQNIIKRDCRHCRIEVLHKGEPMTRDLDHHRVRIVADDHNHVAEVPRRG